MQSLVRGLSRQQHEHKLSLTLTNWNAPCQQGKLEIRPDRHDPFVFDLNHDLDPPDPFQGPCDHGHHDDHPYVHYAWTLAQEASKVA